MKVGDLVRDRNGLEGTVTEISGRGLHNVEVTYTAESHKNHIMEGCGFYCLEPDCVMYDGPLEVITP